METLDYLLFLFTVLGAVVTATVSANQSWNMHIARMNARDSKFDADAAVAVASVTANYTAPLRRAKLTSFLNVDSNNEFLESRLGGRRVSSTLNQFGLPIPPPPCYPPPSYPPSDIGVSSVKCSLGEGVVGDGVDGVEGVSVSDTSLFTKKECRFGASTPHSLDAVISSSHIDTARLPSSVRDSLSVQELPFLEGCKDLVAREIHSLQSRAALYATWHYKLKLNSVETAFARSQACALLQADYPDVCDSVISGRINKAISFSKTGIPGTLCDIISFIEKTSMCR
jgi:hypothetical protein